MPVDLTNARPLDLSRGLAIGAQYYRAPTPPPEDWERDLTRLREHGMDTVKYWVQWRSNTPAPGGFDFADVDQLMALARRLELRVVLNVIFDVMPAWLVHEYPDCLMVRCDGRVVHPTGLGHRQIGGAPGPCLHHAGALQERRAFLEATVARYAGQEALWLWDLWNEPELTCGLVRGGPAAEQVCWCDSSRACFIEWLRVRYADLGALNRAWARNYTEWSHVELPRERTVSADWTDWRIFFRDTLTGEMRWRADLTRWLDPRTPVMCHTVPPPIFNVASCGSDDFDLARECDVFGCTSSCTLPVMVDYARSAGAGRPMIASEIHALPGSTLTRPSPLGPENLRRQILYPLFEGVRGFLFWQYRAELLGAEGPAWGMTRPDGTPEPWLRDLATLSASLGEHREFLAEAEPPASRVAVAVSPENEVFFYTHDGSLDRYWAGVMGAYDLLRDLGHRVDFVDETTLRASGERYAALLAPVPYALPRGMAEALTGYVERGGTLISEGFPCALDPTTGLSAATNPGMGLDALLGCRERRVVPSSKVDIGRSYGVGGLEPSDLPRFRLEESLGALQAYTEFDGRSAEQRLELTTAESFACFGDGSHALTRSAHGDGRAWLVGCWIFAAYRETRDAQLRVLVDAMVGSVGQAVRPDDEFYAPMLRTPDGRAWVLVDNPGGSSATRSFTLSASYAEAGALLGRGSARVSGNRLTCALPADCVEIVALAP